MKKRYILCTAACLLLLAGCGGHDHRHKQPIRLSVTHPTRENSSIVRDFVCQIHSIQHIDIRALEKGYINDVFIDEGQIVTEGKPLFQIMPSLYQAEQEKAKAEFEFASIEYANTEKLRKDGVVAPSELRLAKAKLDKAQAELDLAIAHLNFASVIAPFDGLTGRLHVRKGSLVEEGELLTTLSDNNEMWVYFNVPEAEYLEYMSSKGTSHRDRVKLLLANKQEYQHPGKITAIEADFNNETGNIAFRATFPNPYKLLRHGQTGTILMERPVENALIIPQKGTFEILDRRYVYVIGEDNALQPKAIEVIEEVPDLFIINNGISENDLILIDGLQKVRAGDVIEPVKQDPAKVFASLKVYAE